MRGLAACFFSHLAAIAGPVEERPAVETAADARYSSSLDFTFFPQCNMTARGRLTPPPHDFPEIGFDFGISHAADPSP